MKKDGWQGARSHPDTGRPATRRPLQGCRAPTFGCPLLSTAALSIDVLRSSLLCPGLILLGWWALGRSWDPHLWAGSLPHIQEVGRHLMPGTRATDGSPDKPHHLFLKTGGSPGNRAGTEEALP